jgi:hypothetical protein
MPKFPEVPDEYLKAIGEVTVRWNYLEQMVNLFLIHLLGKSIAEDRSHIVFAHMAFPQKMDVMGALVEELSKLGKPIAWTEYKSTVQPILKKAQSGRNMVIHSLWGKHEGKVKRASISARGSLKFSWIETTLQEIEDVTQSIEEARATLSALAGPDWKESIRLHKVGKT